MKLQKYKLFESMFCHYQWCRRFYGGFWIRLHEQGYDWVKFDKKTFMRMSFMQGTTFSIEDYTGCCHIIFTKVF